MLLFLVLVIFILFFDLLGWKAIVRILSRV
jgi:hypothetical protein